MNFRKIYDFLRDLQRNNSKEWMDANRNYYHEVRDEYIAWLNELDRKLQQADAGYTPTDGRKAINRINNNLMFHPEKPIYKDHFGAGLDLGGSGKQGDFYIHLGTNESFMAGGFYKPKKELLDSIRQAIDYNGAELKSLVDKKSFKDMFTGFMHDGNSLKTSPKGYSQDHEHIDLLRMKSFAVQVDLTQKTVIETDFMQLCIDVYMDMKPFRDYLNQAVTV